MPVFIKQCYFSKINTKINKLEIISFSKNKKPFYSILAVAKSTDEPGNSNNLQLANKSTPLNRAIFVCSTRTPKELLETLRGSECLYELGMSIFGHTQILSMVACNGKGFALCYVPIVVVFQPVTRYRPNPGKFSGSLHQSQLELSAMIYKFLLLGSQRLKITVHAKSKAEALSRIQFASKPLLVARLRNASSPRFEGVAYA